MQPSCQPSCCQWAWLIDELKLEVAANVESPLDRAALSLAVPTLGIIARNNLLSYRGILMRLAFHVTLGNPVDEDLLRRYASHHEATWAGCEWLNSVTLAKGMVTGYHQVQSSSGRTSWHLLDGDGRAGAWLLCRLSSGAVMHYEGGRGAERVVRVVFPNGKVQHCDGERGSERVVRAEHPNGEWHRKLCRKFVARRWSSARKFVARRWSSARNCRGRAEIDKRDEGHRRLVLRS